MNGMCVDDLEASRLVECPPRPVACPKVSTRMAPAGAPVERTYITFYLFFKDLLALSATVLEGISIGFRITNQLLLASCRECFSKAFLDFWTVPV